MTPTNFFNLQASLQITLIVLPKSISYRLFKIDLTFNTFALIVISQTSRSRRPRD